MSKLLISRWFHMILLLALLGGMMFVRIKEYPWTKTLSFIAFDAYNNIEPRQPTGTVAMVDIDEQSLGRDELGQWPWSRLVMAKLVDNLKAMGAKAIVFDIVFAENDRTSPQAVLKRLPKLQEHPDIVTVLNGMPDNDEVFAQSIKNAGNVVTGFIWSGDKNATRRKPVLSQPILALKASELKANVPEILAAATNVPVLAEAAAGNGCFGVTTEVDGIIRRIPLLFRYVDEKTGETTLYPSLALEAIRVSQGDKTIVKVRTLDPKQQGTFGTPLRMRVGDYEIPVDSDGEFYTYFSPTRRGDYIPAWTVINGTVDSSKIRGKIVFVGTSAEGLKDIRSTPLDLFVPGVEAHINVAEQILSGNYLLRPAIFKYAELFGIAGTSLLIILLLPFVGAVAMAVFTAALVAIIVSMSWYGFHIQHLLLDPIYPSICVITIFGLSVLLSYIRTEAERRQVKSAFGHYISPDLLNELAKNPDKLKLGGETRELTVMFTDIRGFTTIAESMKPEELIQLMNDFLTPMSDLVMSNRGTIDKYMGDAMMAFWNAPLDDSDHARHACAAALKMNRALDPINDGLRQRAQNLGRPPLLLKAGIGVNSGSTSVGNMGSKQRFAYSAIGDTVNLASRLEGQTRTYNASVIIGEATQKFVPDFATLELDLIQVKGKTEPARIFALVGDEVYASPEFKKWAATHSDMMKAYRDADFELAMRMMEKCREQAEPRFKNLYALYEERIREMLAHPPAKDWDGVYVATSKK